MEVIFSSKLAEQYPQFSITKFVEEGGDILALDLCNATILRQRILIVPLLHSGANSDEARVKKMVFLFAQYDLPLVNYIVDSESEYAKMIADYLTQYLGTEDVKIANSDDITKEINVLCEKYGLDLTKKTEVTVADSSSKREQALVKHDITFVIKITDEDKKTKLDETSALEIEGAKTSGEKLIVPVSFTSNSSIVDMNEVLHNISKIFKSVVTFDKKKKKFEGKTAFGSLIANKTEVVLLPHLIPTNLPLSKFISGTFKVGARLASDPEDFILEVK